MRKLMTCLGTATLLMLGACGDGAETNEDVTSIEVPEGDYASRLQTMEEGQRNATFIRAIRDAGRDCQGVESSFYQGQQNGVPTWTARCGDGVEWIIMLGNDGVAQVVNAAELRAAQPVQ